MQAISVRRYRRQGDPLARRYRRQAIQAFPVLALVLSGGASDESAGDLCLAVDRGLPLVDAAAAAFEVPRNVVRHMLRRPVAQFGWRWLSVPRLLFRLLALLPPEHRPATKGGWTAFSNCVSWLARWDVHPLADPVGALWLRENARMGFDGLHRSLWHYRPAASICTPPLASLKRLLGDLDLLARQNGLEPALVRKDGLPPNGLARRHPALLLRPFALAVFGSKPGFQALLRLARGYQHESASQDRRERCRPVRTRWDPLWPHPFLCEGLRVVPLRTPRELHEEGQRMHHCVGQYAERCATEATQIVSIRDSWGHPVSTAELAITLVEFKRARLILRVDQHKGSCNLPPPEDANRALAVYLDFLARRVPLDRARQILRAAAAEAECRRPETKEVAGSRIRESMRRRHDEIEKRLPGGMTLMEVFERIDEMGTGNN